MKVSREEAKIIVDMTFAKGIRSKTLESKSGSHVASASNLASGDPNPPPLKAKTKKIGRRKVTFMPVSEANYIKNLGDSYLKDELNDNDLEEGVQ